MNDTPCSLCNHYRREIALSIARREYDRLKWLEDQQYKHKKECTVVNSLWYRNLWVGVDVVVVEVEG